MADGNDGGDDGAIVDLVDGAVIPDTGAVGVAGLLVFYSRAGMDTVPTPSF